MDFHTNLTDDELQEFKEAFSILDRAGKGKITAQELRDFLSSLGQIDPTIEEITELIKDVDKENKGAIDFPQFLQLMEMNSKGSDKDKQASQAFKMFETQSTDDAISVEKMQSVLEKLGETLTAEEIKDMIDEIEQNDKGQLTFNGFKRMINSEIKL